MAAGNANECFFKLTFGQIRRWSIKLHFLLLFSVFNNKNQRKSDENQDEYHCIIKFISSKSELLFVSK